MKKNRIKQWRTTIGGILAAGLVILGIFMPEAVDAETGEAIKSAVDELIVSGGGLIALIVGLLAKDK